MSEKKLGGLLKTALIGKSRDLSDRNVFHKLSLIAFFAWVGLGADGLSSSCYGPEETFKALNDHVYLSLLVAAATVLTVFIISASYSQIIELFPSGGGGYLVASKLLSPTMGVVSGWALLIDYVLTITLSVASGADALFSLLPASDLPYKLPVEAAGVCMLTVLNLRGAKEAVLPWVPDFCRLRAHPCLRHRLFRLGHPRPPAGGLAAALPRDVSTPTGSGLAGHGSCWCCAPTAWARAPTPASRPSATACPSCANPGSQTGKRTMRYMAISLAVTVGRADGRLSAFQRTPPEGKTLNAVLFERLTANWPHGGAFVFILVTLASEAALLFVAAQTGFLDGPRVLSNMALDRWFPTRFATLSDRFVTHNGIVLMGGFALVLMLVSRGSVDLLVVLYSINVFITFTLSQLGMVRHWWQERRTVPTWKQKWRSTASASPSPLSF